MVLGTQGKNQSLRTKPPCHHSKRSGKNHPSPPECSQSTLFTSPGAPTPLPSGPYRAIAPQRRIEPTPARPHPRCRPSLPSSPPATPSARGPPRGWSPGERGGGAGGAELFCWTPCPRGRCHNSVLRLSRSFGPLELWKGALFTICSALWLPFSQFTRQLGFPFFRLLSPPPHSPSPLPHSPLLRPSASPPACPPPCPVPLRPLSPPRAPFLPGSRACKLEQNGRVFRCEGNRTKQLSAKHIAGCENTRC